MQALPPAKDEAAAAAAEASVTAPIPPPRPGTKAGKPTTLLDVQEVGWITRELERLLAREQKSGAGAGADWRRHRRTKTAKLSPAPRKGGFLAELLGRHAVSICGGSDAIVGSSAAAAGVDRRGSRRGGCGSCREVEMA